MILIILFMLLAVVFLWACIAAVIVWAVQFAILNLTAGRFRPLRWALPAVSVLLLCWGDGEFPYIGEILAGTVLLGWGLGWLVYNRICGGDHPPGPGSEEKNANERGHA